MKLCGLRRNQRFPGPSILHPFCNITNATLAVPNTLFLILASQPSRAPCLKSPYFHKSIVASSRQKVDPVLLDRAPLHAIDILAMSSFLRHQLREGDLFAASRFEVHGLILRKNAHAVVSRGRRDEFAVRGEVHAEDGSGMIARDGASLRPTLRRGTAVARSLPHDDGEVVAAGCHARTRRVPRHRPHCAGMTLAAGFGGQRLRARPVLLVRVLHPQLDGVVVAGRHERVPCWVPGHVLDVLGVPVEHGHALELFVLLHLPDPHGFVAPAGGKHVRVRMPGHALDLVFVSLEGAHARPVLALSVPDGGGGVEAPECEIAACSVPPHCADGALVNILKNGRANPG
mmetsp:Transcript_17475/g.33431  ORF Transcript_17475/g.33431 Transcript_17475/m.33431 type:complete len:344 (+) Transcript_17475:80-1111(+)